MRAGNTFQFLIYATPYIMSNSYQQHSTAIVAQACYVRTKTGPACTHEANSGDNPRSYISNIN